MRILLLALLATMPASADETDAALGFRIWLGNYRTAAEARGLKREWLDAGLAEAVYMPRVVSLDRAQPDDSGRRNIFADYLARQLNDVRINQGRARAADNLATLQAVAASTGVAPEIIIAIWGMETSYGAVTGNFDLPSALATLAYDGRRAELFTRELDAAVRMVGEGKATREQMRGSWAGAFGQPQFLPSSYLAHAADGNGDGRIDIWGSVPDTFASIGRYLADAGWKAGVPWGFRTLPPPGFDRASVANPVVPTTCIRPLQRHSLSLPARDWRARGFQPVNAMWPADDVPMALVEPDGDGQGAYLVTANYRAIMEYNCSNFYALSVALLGDAVATATR
ncbi:lytic murein transglycosylase [Sandarakinorhabdus sp. DWP1-3-1]|uniref:lytic murein transglycosylase n=1 Tax=Sandarakinorhabdus sp. DWP1-3-1 TaxID=2804627 RepID=UPI003CF974A7